MKITEVVDKLISAKVVELGYMVYEVEYLKQLEGYVLTIYIDSPEGITLDDCEKTSRAIEPLLDEADPIPQAYYLSVSSIGIDRPLKTDADFNRNLGKVVDVKLYSPKDGKKIFSGKLEAYDKEGFSIRVVDGKSEKTLNLLRKDAAHICPHIDFK